MIRNLPDIVDMLARLVSLPSVSSHDPRLDSGNRAVIECLAEWLAGLGFSVELVPVPRGTGKFNLIATAGSGEEGLVLSGHADTVPYDEGAWSSDPFKLTERDGRLYGLGSADMKVFFPLVIEALRQVNPATLKRPVTVLATADEESSMAGAKLLSTSGRRLGRYAVIGEPTGLKPIRMHKGVMAERIRLRGRSGHASDPGLGNSALEGMHRVIGALLRWRAELQRRYRDPLFAVQVPTLNLGHIHGGDSANRICGDCDLHVDIRLLPGMDLSAMRGEMRARVADELRDTGLRFEVTPLFDGLAPFATAADAEVVKVAEDLTGSRAGAVMFGTEAPFFHAMDMETVILGAGDIACAHQPDEYVPVSHLQPMIQIIRGFIDHFCMRA